MNLIDRVKNVLLTPAKEFQVIDSEPSTPATLSTTYLLPLILIGTVASFIGYGLIGMNLGFGYRFKSTELGLKMALMYAIVSFLGVFIMAFIVDALAPNFGAEKNFNKSFQLAAYVATPGAVAAIFLILPSLAIIASLAGIYGLYLLWVGLPILKKPAADKQTNYFVVVLVVAIIVNIVLLMIGKSIFYPKTVLDL
jgi:succinate dehydrogenase/fumarate reductase cytochrome b subunit